MEEIRIEDYVTEDVAKLIKEKHLYNLNYPRDHCFFKGRFLVCSAIVSDMAPFVCIAPALHDMQRWLREVPNISVEVYTNASGWCWQLCKAFKHSSVSCGTWIDDFTNHFDEKTMNDGGSYDTYEAALNAGIKEALKRL